MKRLFLLTGLMVLISISLLLVSTGSVYGKSSAPKGKPFVEIQGQFIELEGQIESISEQLDTLVGQVESLEDRVTANEAAISGLVSEGEIIEQQIGTLISESAANSEEIVAALSQIDDLSTAIAALDPTAWAAEIADLQTQIDDLQDFVSINTEGLQTLESQLDNNHTLILALEAQIAQIGEELAEKQDVLTGHCPEGMVLQDFDGLGMIECASLNATAGVQKNTITQLFTVSKGALNITTHLHCSTHQHCSFFGCETHTVCTSHDHSFFVNGSGETTITCPDGTFLTGGGFINDHPESVTITRNSSTSTVDYPGQSWIVTATNTSETAFDVYASADCVSFLQ